MPTEVAIFPTSSGCAVHAGDTTRLLPWAVAVLLLDDPTLVVHTMAPGELSPWDGERLLAAIVADDPAARVILAGPWPPPRLPVHELPRHRRRWLRTVDIGVVIGDLEAACCRAGVALPGDDPLRTVATIAWFAERERSSLAVRQRLLDDHPWIGDSAWMASTGLLAEQVILHGLRRDQVRKPVQASTMPVAEMLGDPGRFQARRVDVSSAMRAILDGEAIAEVVAEASAVTDFALWRRARHLLWGNEPVRRDVVRWVVGQTGLPIIQEKGSLIHSTVAKHAIPVDDPAQVDLALVDRSWYVAEAQDLVDRVMGTIQGSRQLSLLDEVAH